MDGWWNSLTTMAHKYCRYTLINMKLMHKCYKSEIYKPDLFGEKQIAQKITCMQNTLYTSVCYSKMTHQISFLCLDITYTVYSMWLSSSTAKMTALTWSGTKKHMMWDRNTPCMTPYTHIPTLTYTWGLFKIHLLECLGVVWGNWRTWRKHPWKQGETPHKQQPENRIKAQTLGLWSGNVRK